MITTKRKKLLLIISTIIIMLNICVSFLAIFAEVIQKRSFDSLIIEGALRIIMIEKQNRSEEKCLELLEESREINADYSVPNKFIKKYKLDTYSIDNFEVCTFNINANSGKYIFYLHGGGYVDQPISLHYKFLDKLSKELDCTIIMPIYPKAPNYTYVTTIDMVADTYIDLLTRVDSQEISIIGDSAGASMALSVCEYFKESDILQPSNIIMISPFLDATLSNPDIINYLERDPILSLNVLNTRVNSYSGGEEAITNYLVSPLYGDYTGLGKMTIFIGTNEIFLPDARVFHSNVIELGIEINYYEYDKMLHGFPIYPIPESKEVRNIIKNIMSKNQ